MTDQLTATMPLAPGKLAPAFELQTPDGEIITRNQFRNRSALLILFFQEDGEIRARLDGILQDAKEYAELNVRLLAIGHKTATDLTTLTRQYAPSITFLADPAGRAWSAYTHRPPESGGYAAFMLDLYGGVDAQYVATSVAEMPDSNKLLEWARAAQYRCSI